MHPGQGLKATQELLVELAKLAAVGKLVPGIIHEINNPLAIIMSYSQTLSMDLEPGPTRKGLEIIFDQVQRAYGVANNLLFIAQQHSPAKTLVDLHEPLARVLVLQSYYLSLHNIKVVKEIPENLPKVMANDGELSQVLLQMVTNAEQAMFMQNGAGVLTLKAWAQKGFVGMTVQDDGPGIDPEHVDRVFEPFFTTKQPGENAGLGLNVCKKFVEQHGGYFGWKASQEREQHSTSRFPWSKNHPDYSSCP